MSTLKAVNLRGFRQRVRHRKAAFRKFLSKLEKHPPRGLDTLTAKVEKEVWKQVDCLTCANCCKEMSPTYTNKDIRRIASHFQQSPADFKKQWLKKDRSGDWLNKSTPCQFLNLEDNKCGIYAIRPADCAGFPHLPKKKMVDYIHVHKQNIEYCPATYKMVESMMMHLK
jgi:Fe-S-cluster containining protein